MALEKKTVKIIAIAVAAAIVVVVLLGLLLGLLLRSSNIASGDTKHLPIELQVWPRGADGSANPVISYKSSNNESVLAWVQRIDDFLSEYRKPRDNRIACDFTRGPPQGDQVCDVRLDDFYPCVASNQYNYRAGAPCVFLKLDNIVDWTPKPYNVTDDLPQTMPEDLKKHIKQVAIRPEVNEVWVSCEGVDNAANKGILGPVKFLPRLGFPMYYFPNKNKAGYLSPLVAVMFERPAPNMALHVECKAWAKNINSCKDCEHTASVRFQIKIEP